MATQQELIVKIRGDIEDIQQKLSAVQKSVGKTQSAFSKIGGGIAKVGKGIAVAGAAVSGAAALIGKKSLDAAAYVEEMENKFNVVFSNTSSAMDEWADNFANAIGRNNTEIKTAISNQADLMIGMGMSEEAAGDLAKQYTTLAYDLASFNNVNDEQAVEAMTKALMGETEMMKALGVNISDTIMEQSEFVKASGKAWKAMTMEEKAQMRLLEAQKQSVNALGDAERSAASYTNQLKRLKGNIQKVHEVIGKYLLPIFTPLVSKMGDAAQAVGNVIEKFGTAWQETGKLSDGFAAIADDMETFKTNLINGISNGLQALVDSLPQFMKTGGEMIISLAQGLVNELPTLMLRAQELVMAFGEGIILLLPGLIEVGAQMILNLIVGLSNALPNIATKAIEIVSTLFNSLIQQLPTLLEAGIQAIQGIIDGIITALPLLIQQAPVIIQNLLQALKNNIPKLLDAALEAIKTIVQGLIDNIPLLVDSAIEIIDSLIAFITDGDNLNKVLNSMFEIIDAVVDGLIKAIPLLVDAAVRIIDKLVEFITTPGNLSKLIQMAIQLVMKIAEGLIQALPTLIGSAGELVSAIVNTLLTTNWFSVGADILAGIGKGLMNGVWDIAKNLGTSLMNGVKSILGIHSPSREFIKIGGFTMAGLEEGINDEMRTIDNQMKAVGTTMMSSFEGSAELKGDVLGGGYYEEPQQNTTINLNGSYMFQDKDSMDYFMNKLALAVQRG